MASPTLIVASPANPHRRRVHDLADETPERWRLMLKPVKTRRRRRRKQLAPWQKELALRKKLTRLPRPQPRRVHDLVDDTPLRWRAMLKPVKRRRGRPRKKRPTLAPWQQELLLRKRRQSRRRKSRSTRKTPTSARYHHHHYHHHETIKHTPVRSARYSSNLHRRRVHDLADETPQRWRAMLKPVKITTIRVKPSRRRVHNMDDESPARWRAMLKPVKKRRGRPRKKRPTLAPWQQELTLRKKIAKGVKPYHHHRVRHRDHLKV